MAINATIQVRRGLLKDFDPTKMLPGEWAVSIDASTSNQIVWMCFAPGVCKRMGTYEDFQNMIYNATGEIIERYEDAFGSILEEVNTNAEAVSANTDIVLVAKSDIINTYLPQIKSYVSNASASASEAKTYSDNAKASASEADKSAEDAKKYSQNAFSTTPAGYEVLVGDVDLLKNSIIQTTERTLYGSNAGGIKLIGIGGASEQKQYSGKNLVEAEDMAFTTSDTTEREFTKVHLTPGTYTLSWTQNETLTSNQRNTPLYRVDGGGYDTTKWYSTSANVNLSKGRYSWTIEITEENDYSFLYWAHTASNDVSISEIQLALGTDADYEPYVGATPSPNPIYPQEIESVGDIKNLLEVTATSQTVNGGTVTVNADKSITVNGTFTALTNLDIISKNIELASGGILSGCPSGGSANTYNIQARNNTTSKWFNNYSGDTELTAGEYNRVILQIAEGATVNNLTFKPMIRKASIKNSEYKPYGYSLGIKASNEDGTKSKSITIPLNEPLRGIGEVKDEIVCQDGVWGVNRWSYKKILDSTAVAQGFTNIGTVNRVFFTIGSATVGTSTTTDFMTTSFQKVTDYTLDKEHCYLSNGDLFVFINADRLTSQDAGGVSAWLADNNVECNFIRATPTFEPFTDQTPFYGLESFDTVTYISTDSEVEPSTELKFAKTEGDAVTLLNYNGWNLARLENEALKNAVLSLGGNV